MARRNYKYQYKVLNEAKYTGNPDSIVCRSSWELAVCKHLDDNTNVRRWASEEIIVPYESALDGKPHRYFVDFYVELMDDRKFLVEVKPKCETTEPVYPKPKKKGAKIAASRLRSYESAIQTYLVNMSKWKAAKEFAAKRGMKFVIWTEDELRKIGVRI